MNKIFSPEHGFKGSADAGAYIDNNKYRDIPVVSLYGKKKKPNIADLQGIEIKIYDIQGRVVGELMSGIQSQGLYEIAWNADLNASGIYFVRLVAGAEIHTQKITLVK